MGCKTIVADMGSRSRQTLKNPVGVQILETLATAAIRLAMLRLKTKKTAEV